MVEWPNSGLVARLKTQRDKFSRKLSMWSVLVTFKGPTFEKAPRRKVWSTWAELLAPSAIFSFVCGYTRGVVA